MYQRIRNLREDMDLNQQVLADMLNVSQSTYSKYENGTRGIPNIYIIKLAQFYRTSIDYLVGLTDNKQPYR